MWAEVLVELWYDGDQGVKARCVWTSLWCVCVRVGLTAPRRRRRRVCSGAHGMGGCDEHGFVDDAAQALKLIPLLKRVSKKLSDNEGAVGADGKLLPPTKLFLHFDEFVVVGDDVDQYFRAGMSAESRYRAVRKKALMPILRTPNVFLIVTGRPPELALIGRLVSLTSPCAGHHAVLTEDNSMQVCLCVWCFCEGA